MVELKIFYASLLLAIDKIVLIVFSIFEILCNCLSCLPTERNQNIQNDSIMKMDGKDIILSN